MDLYIRRAVTMEPQRKVKFYQTQTFRALIAMALAAVLLACSGVGGMDSFLGIESEAVLGVEEVAPEENAGSR